MNKSVQCIHSGSLIFFDYTENISYAKLVLESLLVQGRGERGGERERRGKRTARRVECGGRGREGP